MSDTRQKSKADTATLTVQGRLGKDVEVRHTKGGKRIASTSIAIGQRKRNAAGSWEDDATMWFKLTSFGSDLDQFEKGDKVIATGRLRMEIWENRDQEKVTSYEVLVDSAELVSKPKPPAETDLPNTAGDEYPE